jgi:outer membrane protein assembly factor BamB
MRSLILIGIAILLLIGVAQAGDWPMFGHDAAHTGATDEVVEPPLELLWKYPTDNGLSSPVVSGGTVYVGSGDGYVYALEASSGNLKWKYQTGYHVQSSPAVSEGIVYVGSKDNYVYALDATTGTLKWEYATGGEILNSPTVFGRVVYVGSMENVYALDALTGALKWKYMTIGSGLGSSPAVSGGVVFVGILDNIYALDALTGSLKWKSKIGGVVLYSSPAVSGSLVYIGSTDNNIYALDTFTGAIKWKYATGGGVQSSPAVADGMVYVGSNDKNIYALDALTGVLKWKYTTGGGYFYSPIVSDGVVYIGSYDKNIYALDTLTGVVKWKYMTGDKFDGQPAISNGIVFVSNGNLYAFEHSKTTSSDSITATSSLPKQTTTTITTETPALETSEPQDKTNWVQVSTILTLLLIGVIIFLLYKLKKSAPRAIKEPVPKFKPPQRYKIKGILLIIILIVIGAIGYTIYQKYSPLAELANCGNNCIDYQKVKVAQYETSIPDIKITNADADKLIMDVPIIIRNPSAKDTETVKIDFDISMEGKHLTKGTIPAYELPAKQNTTILIKDVVIKYEELGEVLKTVASKHGAEVVTEGKANISMTTDLLIYFPIEIFGINIYTFTIPIQIESEVPVDMLKQNEEAKKQIEEKVSTAIKEVQEKIKDTLPAIPTKTIPSPTATLPQKTALPLPTPSNPQFP